MKSKILLSIGISLVVAFGALSAFQGSSSKVKPKTEKEMVVKIPSSINKTA